MKTLAYLTFFLSLNSAIAQNATEKAPARTGSGDAVYEVVRAWGSYPEGKKMGSLHGDMASDSQGNVYFAAKDGIHVFGPDGKFVKDLGTETRGIHGMKVRKQGDEEFLFIAQNGLKRVAKLKLDGTVVWSIVGHPKVEGMYPNPGAYNPTDVDVAPDGTLYVADGYGMSLMHIYDKDQKYVKTFGGKGTAYGQFNVCHNVLVDTRKASPSLVISDRQNNRVHGYDMDGNFVKLIAAGLRQPCAADIFGDRLAVGELGGRVSVFDKDNQLMARLGDEPTNRAKGNGAPPEKWIEGALTAVHGLTFDKNGDLYAMEYSRYGRATKYTPVETKK
ncbi:MAG: hypothetical protein ACI8XO_001858 [Verrucomicrobiales bacterium]|jgi:hypothetical protein